MKIEEYEQYVREGWTLGDALSPTGLFVACVGLAGEGGEVLEPIKKAVRRAGIENGERWRAAVDRRELTLELGDALFHVVKIAQIFDVPLTEVMAANREKMQRRWAEGHRRDTKTIARELLAKLDQCVVMSEVGGGSEGAAADVLRAELRRALES